MVELPHKAISIRQPWAWAVVYAGKEIENRDWPTGFRGSVCIHAAKGMGKQEYADAASFITRTLGSAPDQDWLMRWHGICAAPYRLDRGGIIGVADTVDCVSHSDSPWFFGRFGFVLRNARPVDLIPLKGALGFFDWRKQMGGQAHG